MHPHILSRDEIAALNKDGSLQLSDDGFYLQLFLFNDTQNHAADPIPFKIRTASLDKIAKTAIGRPWIVHPDGSKHVRGASDNPADIIKHQKAWAHGETVAAWRNESSNNVHVITKVFPEYVPAVKAGRIPKSPYLSPLIAVKSEENGEITDADVLHVQSVDAPGYDPEIAKISGMCEGMLGECMAELRTLGAAGQLQAWRRDNSLGSSDEESSDSMAPQATTLTAEQITELIKSGLKEGFEQFEQKHSKILGASGAAAATEQVEKKPTEAGKDASGNAAQEGNIISDSIKEHPEFKALEEKVQSLEAANAEASKKAAIAERTNQAMQIVEIELLTKDLAIGKKGERIKELVNGKDDLASLAKYLQSKKRSILGASGYAGEMAELTTEGTSAEPTGFELEERFQ